MKKAICVPLLSSMLIIILLYLFKIPDITVSKIDFVLNAIITCAVTLAGFILTSVSIIIGMSGSPIMKKINKEGGLPELVLRYTITLILSLSLIFSFIFLGATIQADNLISSKCLIIGAGILTSYLTSLISTCYYLLSIISKIPSNKSVETVNESTVPNGEFR